MSAIVIRNVTALTVAPVSGLLALSEGVDIRIEDDLIVAIGPRLDPTAGTVINGRGMLAMPGLVNGHNHFEQSFMNGLVRLFPGSTAKWINEFKIPLTRMMNADDYRLSAALTCLNMVRSGVTTSMNHMCQQPRGSLIAFGVAESAKAILSSGVRAVMAIGMADKSEPDDFLIDAPAYIGLLRGWHSDWDSSGQGRLRIWPGPTGFWCTTPAMWKAAHEFAVEMNTGIHTHLATFERGDVFEAIRCGVLDERFTGAHAVWLNDTDVREIAARGARVAHSPTYKLSYSLDSDVKTFGDGIAPIADLHAAGATVALGQDGCMGDTQDLFKEMRMLAFTQHYRYRDKTLYPPRKLIEMATIEGARSLDWEDEIGSLEPGKKADLILVDLSASKFVPRHDLLTSVVYQAGASDVDTVIVNGELLMRERTLVHIDEARIIGEAQEAAADLVERAGLDYLLQR